jgi:hypothetical protein
MLYIERLRTLNENAAQKLVFEHLYTNLDVLDTKSSSLIQFVATLTTIYAGLIALRFSDLHRLMNEWVLNASLFSGAVCIFVAGILFLLVERVFWSPAEDIADPDTHARNLLEVRDHRTVQYRLGWLFSIGAYILLMITLIVAVVQYLVFGAF